MAAWAHDHFCCWHHTLTKGPSLHQLLSFNPDNLFCHAHAACELVELAAYIGAPEEDLE